MNEITKLIVNFRKKLLKKEEIDAITQLEIEKHNYDGKDLEKLNGLTRFGRYLYQKRNLVESKTHKVSIIIPVFNSEKNIARCVESALYQSFQNIEIIIVNDCSTDNTRQILEKLSIKNHKINLINRKNQSGGPSLPRMEALKIATGEYIYFLDSDDWIDGDFILRLINEAKKNNSDITITSGYYNHYADKTYDVRKYKNEKILKGVDSYLGRYHESFFLWDKIYKKSFINKYNLQLANTDASEEVPFLLKAYYYANNISEVKDYYGYHYSRNNEGSITITKRFVTFPYYELTVWDNVSDWIRDKDINKNYLDVINLKKIFSLTYALQIVNHSHYEKFFKLVKNNFIDIDLDQYKKALDHLKWKSKYNEVITIINGEILEYKDKFNINKVDVSNDIYLGYCPDWSNANPYQQLLYQAINKITGIKCEQVNFKEIQKNTIQFASKYKYLHLHWIHGWVDFYNVEELNNAFDTLKNLQKLGVKILWTVHNIVTHDSKDNDYEIKVRKKLSSYVDKVLVHSNLARALVSRTYDINNNKIHILEHGHYDQYYGEHREKLLTRKSMNLPVNDFIISFIGEIKPYKGFTQIFDEILELINKYNVNVLIAGDCKDNNFKNRIEELRNKNKRIFVHLRRINNNDIRNFYCASDLTVLPYKSYLTSGSGILSLTYNCPIVCPEGSINEILNKYKIGITYGENSHSKTLIDALKKILSEYSQFKVLDTFFEPKDFDKFYNEKSFYNIVKEQINNILK